MVVFEHAQPDGSSTDDNCNGHELDGAYGQAGEDKNARVSQDRDIADAFARDKQQCADQDGQADRQYPGQPGAVECGMAAPKQRKGDSAGGNDRCLEQSVGVQRGSKNHEECCDQHRNEAQNAQQVGFVNGWQVAAEAVYVREIAESWFRKAHGA